MSAQDATEGERHGVILAAIPGEDPAPFAAMLDAAGFDVVIALGAGGVFEAIHVRTPSCIVTPFLSNPGAAANLIQELKTDHAYGHLPLVLLLSPEQAIEVDWSSLPGDEFVVLPNGESYLGTRLRLCIERAARDLDANPLTGLPGNLTIMREAERRIARGQAFAMGHIDLDNFKPFNDKYGFSRGDEVLRMTARVVVNAVRALRSPDTYVGHIGGDDFIFMAPSELAEAAGSGIISGFDQIVPNFYDETDRRAGSILSLDRQGAQQTFPLMGCSIAIVDTAIAKVSHLGELSARAAELKKYAKAAPGSTYLIDRRR